MFKILILILVWAPFWLPLAKETLYKNEYPITLWYQRTLSSEEKIQITSKFPWNQRVLFKEGIPDRWVFLESLLSELHEKSGVHILKESPWGPSVYPFLEKAKPFIEEKRLFFEWENKAHEEGLFIQHVDVSPRTLLGQGSASIHFVGYLKEKKTINVLIRNEKKLLKATYSIDLPKGKIDLWKVLRFSLDTLGTQAIFIEAHTPESINAVAWTQVFSGKMQMLHLGVGPDETIRNTQQKIKLLTHSELVQYYILRDYQSDLSVRPEELSLIEFPSQQIFGKDIQFFHGIMAQNFDFQTFLQRQERSSLENYILKGGRLIHWMGPRSLKDSRFSPCENLPSWENIHSEDKEYWESSLLPWTHLRASSLAIGCTPKKDIKVIYSYKNHPMVLVGDYGEGLILWILGFDWNTYLPSLDISQRSVWTKETYEFFQWLMEFVQRKHSAFYKTEGFIESHFYTGQQWVQSLKPQFFQNQKLNYLDIHLQKLPAVKKDEQISLEVHGKNLQFPIEDSIHQRNPYFVQNIPPYSFELNQGTFWENHSQEEHKWEQEYPWIFTLVFIFLLWDTILWYFKNRGILSNLTLRKR